MYVPCFKHTPLSAEMSFPVTLPQQEGHDGPVSLHWLIRESIHSKHYITWELV